MLWVVAIVAVAAASGTVESLESRCDDGDLEACHDLGLQVGMAGALFARLWWPRSSRQAANKAGLRGGLMLSIRHGAWCVPLALMCSPLAAHAGKCRTRASDGRTLGRTVLEYHPFEDREPPLDDMDSRVERNRVSMLPSYGYVVVRIERKWYARDTGFDLVFERDGERVRDNPDAWCLIPEEVHDPGKISTAPGIRIVMSDCLPQPPPITVLVSRRLSDQQVEFSISEDGCVERTGAHR